MSASVIPCVGAVATDEQGRLLMIKRGHEPGAGLWSIPGGRIEPGETDAEALVREMLEETSLTVAVGRLLGRVRRPFLDGAVIDIRDYAVTVTGGTLRPGDDAADARWIAAADLNSLEITEGLIDALTEWGVLGNLSPVFPILARKRRLAVSVHGATIRLGAESSPPPADRGGLRSGAGGTGADRRRATRVDPGASRSRHRD